MKKADVKVDAIVSAKSDEEVTKPFLGKVEKIYENSALLRIVHCDPVDATAVNDLNHKLVVNFKNLKATTKKQIKDIKKDIENDIKIEKMKLAQEAAEAADPAPTKDKKPKNN